MAEKKAKQYVIDNAKLMAEWNWEKNNELGFDPETLTLGSGKKVWWKCEKGHSWEAVVSNRAQGHGCPYCSGRLPIAGETDLQSCYPHISAQWDYSKNGDLKPRDVMPKSSKKVWWKCEKGHSWEAEISHRTSGHGCPICTHYLQKSFPETAIYYYISMHFKDAIQSYKSSELGKFEFDIYIPSCKVAIEYDGKAYHQNRNSADRERRKYEIAKKYNIRLIRVREGDHNSINCDLVIFTKLGELCIGSQKYNYELARIINQIFNDVKVPITINSYDVEKNQQDISSILYQYSVQNKELGPLMSECDYDKNGTLLPSMLSLGSNQKVHWKCKHGHSW
ncbi:MAG: zinc-ribbon domain-containing protein, partial [Clostridia bacterium]|nr:zinc-ribbon domain-containing protein [Clostridia bacterium]